MSSTGGTTARSCHGWMSAGILLVRGHGHLRGARSSCTWARRSCARGARLSWRSGGAADPADRGGLAAAQPWTNREATQVRDAPGSLIVIGGGPVGAELAQAFATLGLDVTLLERESQILERDEPFAAEQVAAGLRSDGVAVLTDVQAESVVRGDDGRVTVTTSTHGTLEADEILVASDGGT